MTITLDSLTQDIAAEHERYSVDWLLDHFLCSWLEADPAIFINPDTNDPLETEVFFLHKKIDWKLGKADVAIRFNRWRTVDWMSSFGYLPNFSSTTTWSRLHSLSRSKGDENAFFCEISRMIKEEQIAHGHNDTYRDFAACFLLPLPTAARFLASLDIPLTMDVLPTKEKVEHRAKRSLNTKYCPLYLKALSDSHIFDPKTVTLNQAARLVKQIFGVQLDESTIRSHIEVEFRELTLNVHQGAIA